MPSISVDVDIDEYISEFSNEEIRDEYERRFRYDHLRGWIRTYMNMGNYKEALFIAEKLIPELRGISEKIK